MASDEDQVRNWLSEKGAGFELEVAREFRRYTEVTHARYYVDPTEGKLREVDVIADFHSGDSARWWLSTRYVIECKSGTAPWVLFTNDEVAFTKDENVLELMESRFKDAQKSDLRGTHKVPALSWHRPVAYQIADTGGGNQAAYPAVREVMSAVDGVLSDPVMGYGSQGAVIVIPVVVTRAPLFEVRLGSDGNTELQSVERSLLVSRVRPLDRLDGIWIVHASDVPQFAMDANNGSNGLTFG